jgi:hypothetical protein
MSQNVFTEGLGYEGKITLTLKSNGRVLKTKTYKNAGTAQLFKFLGYCLMGSYEDVKNLLPNKLMLLYNASAAQNGPSIATARNVERRSAFSGLAQTPIIISEDEAVKVTYSFEVPRASTYGGAFNQVALYGAGMTESDFQEFSAFYFLVDDYGDIEALNPGDWSATAVLLIEWELSLSNKTKPNTNTPQILTYTV